MQPIITIFCPFTRRWAIDDWLNDLANVRHDPAQTNICAIVDADEPYITNSLKKFTTARNYRSFHVKENPGHYPNEVRLSARRNRVAEIHEQAKELIAKTDGQIIIGLEDDTAFDRLESFDRLTDPVGKIRQGFYIGFVEGMQIGRWGARMVGAWQADDIHNPKKIETLLPPQPPQQAPENYTYQQITGGGWYGYATTRQLFLDATYYASPSQPWGPDVNFGFYVRQQGMGCLIDWQTVFGHREANAVAYPDDPKIRLAKIVYNKREDNGKWERTDYEPNRN